MSKLKDKINKDNERTIDEEEEPKDLVTLMEERHKTFHKGVNALDSNYKTTGDYLKNYQENS